MSTTTKTYFWENGNLFFKALPCVCSILLVLYSLLNIWERATTALWAFLSSIITWLDRKIERFIHSGPLGFLGNKKKVMFSCYVMLGHSPKHIVLIPEVQLPFFIKHLQNQFFHCLCWRIAAHLGCYRHMVDQWNSVTPLVRIVYRAPQARQTKWTWHY